MSTALSQYVMNSGGAEGSDHVWDKIGRQYGLNNINHFFHGNHTPHGNFRLNDQEIEEGWQMVVKANVKLKRRPQNYKSLLSRNWFPVKYSDEIFAIGTIDFNKNEVKGGTGWAVEMAILTDKRVWVFDQEKMAWYYYDVLHQDFSLCKEPPVLSERFAGIGTRKLLECGENAIRDLYKRTINHENIKRIRP